MLHWLPAPLKLVISALCIALNTLLIVILFLPFALLKLCLPARAPRRVADLALNALADTWVRVNTLLMKLIERQDWKVRMPAGLNPRGWYLVSSNHQTWADVLVLQSVFRGRIPFLKFFLKRELIYVPVIGLAWWALDFPFMRRSGKSLAAAQADMETARKSCEKFRYIPTSVINFLEGTRFTPAKHQAQKSPYRHLLKPKSGGASIALGTMGELFESMLDVTIVYPDGVPSFLDLMRGRLGRVIVDVRALPIPPGFVTEGAARDPQFRSNIQHWLNDVWADKDARIDALLKP